MSDTKHTLSYDPNSIYPRGALGENKCIKSDGEIVAEVFCRSTTSPADANARALAADLVHRYNTHPALMEALERVSTKLTNITGIIDDEAVALIATARA